MESETYDKLMRGGKLRAKTTGNIGKIISLAIWDSKGIPKNWECKGLVPYPLFIWQKKGLGIWPKNCAEIMIWPPKYVKTAVWAELCLSMKSKWLSKNCSNSVYFCPSFHESKLYMNVDVCCMLYLCDMPSNSKVTFH